MNTFTYKGISSSDMGLRIQSKTVYSVPKYDVTFTSVPGRDGDIITSNGRFANATVTYTCFVPAKSIRELSDKLTDIKGWLYAEADEYHELADTYDTLFFRQAVISGKTDISDEAGRIGQFKVSFNCKPMRYSYEGQELQSFTETFVLTNPYAFSSLPYIKLYGTGSGVLTIQSDVSTDIWEFSSLDGYTECDSYSMNFYQDTELKNSTVTGDGFPKLYPGDNAVSFSGGITQADIIPRWRTL